MQERIMKNYNKKTLTANSIEGLIAHEMAHFMSFQDCESYKDFIKNNLSNYANDGWLSGNFTEIVAESFSVSRINEHSHKLVNAIKEDFL